MNKAQRIAAAVATASAIAIPAEGLRRLRFERADGKPPSGMAPGKFRSAAYTVEPPEHTLRLYFVHSCGPGRVVRTEVTPA